MNSNLEKQIFVVFGASKSGTTWLQRMLDAHPEIRCHFQLRLFPFSETEKRKLKNNASGVVFSRHTSPFKEIFEDESEEGSYWLTTSLLQDLPSFMDENLRKACKKYSVPEHVRRTVFNDIYRKFVEATLSESRKKFVGTKSYVNLELMFELFPDAKCIHIVRDGRDVCVSKRFHFARKGVFFHGDEKSRVHYIVNEVPRLRTFLKKRGIPGASYYRIPEKKGRLLTRDIIHKIAGDWANVNEYILSWKERKPDQIFTVSYEQMVAAPHESLARVLAFLGAEDDEETVSKIVEKNTFARLKNDENSSFFRKGQVGDWKNYFGGEDFQTFEDVAGEMSRRLGYE